MAQTEIMIVDDNPANLQLLGGMLRQQGYDVCAYPLGRLALAAAMTDPPGLILLDVNMPEMNGYEVCHQLKLSERLSKVPVIFLSALDGTEDKMKAFRCGAADYISKPFQFEEVHARVETHLALHALRCALEVHNERLEEAVAARTRELSAALERVTVLDRSKSDFLNLISHEFRTPLNGVLGVSEIILSSMQPTAESHELQGLYDVSRRRILSLLDDALLLTQIDVRGEQFKAAAISLSSAVDRALRDTADLAESLHIRFVANLADTGLVAGDDDLLVRALCALIETAVRFSDTGEPVRLSSSVAAGSEVLVVESFGSRLPDAQLARFFDLFSIGETLVSGGDLGVRPALAQRILSLFGGSVSIENRDCPPGVKLTVSLRGYEHRNA